MALPFRCWTTVLYSIYLPKNSGLICLHYTKTFKDLSRGRICDHAQNNTISQRVAYSKYAVYNGVSGKTVLHIARKKLDQQTSNTPI